MGSQKGERTNTGGTERANPSRVWAQGMARAEAGRFGLGIREREKGWPGTEPGCAELKERWDRGVRHRGGFWGVWVGFWDV